MIKKIKNSVSRKKNTFNIKKSFKTKFRNFTTEITKKQLYIPLVVLLMASVVFCITIFFQNRPPQIKKIVPEVALPNSRIEIYGSHLSDSIGSQVMFANERVNSANIIEWTDKRIILITDENVASGMVHIKTRYGLSNGILFTNKNHIPNFRTDDKSVNTPYIVGSSVELLIGGKSKIIGYNLGDNYYKNSIKLIIDDKIVDTVKEDEIISWKDDEIIILLKNDRFFDSLLVETPVAESNLVDCLYKSTNGLRKKSKIYAISYNFRLSLENLNNYKCDYFIWIPLPKNNFNQKILKNDDYFCYIERDINPLEVFNLTKKIKVKTADSRVDIFNNIYYSDYKDILKQSKYDSYMISEKNDFQNDELSIKDFISKMGKSICDDFDYESSIEYANKTNSILDSIGIPNRIVSGAYLNGEELNIHYWNQYFYKGLGWITIDMFNKDKDIDAFMKLNNYENAISGNYILFSTSKELMKKKFSGKNIYAVDNFYSMQNYLIESSGEISDEQIKDVSFELIKIK